MNRAERRAASKAGRRGQGRSSRRVVLNAVDVTVARHQDARPQSVVGLMLELHECFDALKNGSSDDELFDRLASSMNTALIRAESIGQEAVDVILAAHTAMNECRDIYMRHGRFGFTGTGLQAMAEGLELYQQIVSLSTPRQILEAADQAHRRVIAQRKTAFV